MSDNKEDYAVIRREYGRGTRSAFDLLGECHTYATPGSDVYEALFTRGEESYTYKVPRIGGGTITMIVTRP